MHAPKGARRNDQNDDDEGAVPPLTELQIALIILKKSPEALWAFMFEKCDVFAEVPVDLYAVRNWKSKTNDFRMAKEKHKNVVVHLAK